MSMVKEKKIKRIKDMNENEEQAFICSWCLQNNLVPVAVPNGFNLAGAATIMRSYGLPTSELKKQNAIQMNMLKKEGLHTGFPDLMIIGNRGGEGAILFLENKVKGNKPSEIQAACHQWLKNLGYTVEVSKDTKDAIAKIKYFFGENKQYLNWSYLQTRKKILEEQKHGKEKAGVVSNVLAKAKIQKRKEGA